jgi:primosomal protein N' (replication factor Y)
LNQTFTYIIPDELEKMVQIGQRVLAPFGRNHTYTGIIVGLTPHRPETGYELKPIQQVLDEGPIIRHPQYPLWQWIANYYMCPIGDVMKAALPSELKPEEMAGMVDVVAICVPISATPGAVRRYGPLLRKGQALVLLAGAAGEAVAAALAVCGLFI